jgi:microcystin-dependent protein
MKITEDKVLVDKGSSKIEVNRDGDIDITATSDVNLSSGEGADITLNGEKISEIISDISGLVDVVYPVGSVYLSVSETSPSALFGGEWEQIKDTFLLCAGETYDAGATGGEAEHTLEATEIPAHDHDVSVTSSGGGTTGSDGAHRHQIKYDLAAGTGTTKPSISSSGSETSADTVMTSNGSHTHTTPNHTHTISETSVGGGESHNNMPPYLAVYAWKRTA